MNLPNYEFVAPSPFYGEGVGGEVTHKHYFSHNTTKRPASV
jgi:hypothetical protein